MWTPDCYDGTGAYPVLYMHDGQNIFDTVATWNHQTWNMDKTAGALIKNGDIDFDQIYKEADNCVYMSKKSKGNSFTCK